MIAELLGVVALVTVVLTAPGALRRYLRNAPDRAWRASGFRYTSDPAEPTRKPRRAR